MRTVVKGKNIDVPEPVREYAERKMRRLERFLDERSEAIVELSTEQHRSSADSHVVSVSLVMDGRTLHSHAVAPTYQAGLDAVVDRIERQAIDSREKPRSKARPDAERSLRTTSPEAVPAAPAPVKKKTAKIVDESAARSRIVKTKRFAIEPMFEEDALQRMEELGHAFYIFVNAESERLCILYKRRTGDFGLIEPMIGGEYTAGRSGRKG